MFWTPRANAATVLLAPSPPDFAGVTISSATFETTRGRQAPEGRYLTRGTGRETHHFLLLSPPQEHHPLAAVVPMDDRTPERLAAVNRAWQALSGKPGRHGHSQTSQRRARIRRMLLAVDARRDGASHRDIAAVLFGPARIAADPWKTSALRDATLRLVRDGTDLVGGGYHRILRPGRVASD